MPLEVKLNSRYRGRSSVSAVNANKSAIVAPDEKWGAVMDGYLPSCRNMLLRDYFIRSSTFPSVALLEKLNIRTVADLYNEETESFIRRGGGSGGYIYRNQRKVVLYTRWWLEHKIPPVPI